MTTPDAAMSELLDLVRTQQEQLARLTELVHSAGPAEAPGRAPQATVREVVDKAIALTASSSLRTYRSAWKVLVDGVPEAGVAGIGDRPIAGIVKSDLEAFIEPLRDRARRANAERDARRHEVGRQQRLGNGEGAVYNAVGAWRRLWTIAVDDGLAPQNIAAKLRKPRRLEGDRTGFEPEKVSDVVALARAGSDDPELDVMLVKFHLITGARQEGALNLTVRMVEVDQCMVVLDEKNNRLERQPIPDWFADGLAAFATKRGAVRGDDKVFRKRRKDGTHVPITRRRYNSLFERVQANGRWADVHHVTAHTLRHSAGTYIERAAGKSVASAFLRHAITDVTGVYTKASPTEVAAAVVAVWGGTHPLVR